MAVCGASFREATAGLLLQRPGARWSAPSLWFSLALLSAGSLSAGIPNKSVRILDYQVAVGLGSTFD